MIDRLSRLIRLQGPSPSRTDINFLLCSVFSYGFQSVAYRLKHCFLCVFQKFQILNASFGVNFGVSERPKLFHQKNDPKNTWYMFIRSNYTPVQKSVDGPTFFFAPFSSLDPRPNVFVLNPDKEPALGPCLFLQKGH